tara:strand:+ start:722 stop:1453 length:732 start_codon:yes stop_codon:yes gene_type:complete
MYNAVKPTKLIHEKLAYDVWIFKDFFLDEKFQEFKKVITKQNNWQVGGKRINDQESALEREMRFIPLDQESNDLKKITDILHSEENIKYILDSISVENKDIYASKYWSGARLNKKGSQQLIHRDALFSPDKTEYKLFTIMYYFSSPKDDEQGSLEIWSKDMNEMLFSIPATENTVVCFENNEFAWHGVPKCDYDRYAYTMSLAKELDANDKKILSGKYNHKALFVKRPNDPKKISELAIKRFS